MQQLLQQGAACNVHYLFSMDTDQLTGPQVPEKTPGEKFKPILTLEFSGGEEDGVPAFPHQACPKSNHCPLQG